MSVLKNKLSRRGFLGASAAGAAGVASAGFWKPIVARAQGSAPVKRLLLVFSPNGTIPDEFFPSGGETNFQLGQILEPLAPYRQHLLILDRIDQKIVRYSPGDGHQTGMGCLWTGMELMPGDNKGGCNNCAPVSFAGGMSIDQRIAPRIRGNAFLPSVELGTDVGNAENVWTRMIYTGPNAPLPPEQNPWRAFDTLFANVNVDATTRDRERRMRRSVLDFARGQLTAMSPRVGTEARLGLERHAEALRELERRIDAMAMAGAACSVPNLGAEVNNVNADSAFPQMVQAMTDLMVMAFACDRTRVGSIQWNRSVGGMTFPHLGVPDGHHSLSHEGDSNNSAKNKLIQINRWYAEQMAYLLGRLAAIDEGGGKMIDHTLVVWGNELGKGNNHTRNRIPFLLAGNVGGFFRTGRYVTYSNGQSHTDLLTAISHAFGDARNFGDPRVTNGPLSGLT